MQINETEVIEDDDHEKVKKGFLKVEVSNEMQKDDDQDRMKFPHNLIINPDSQWISIFDVFILFLIAFSCINSILNVCFPIVQSPEMFIVFWIGEILFYIDFTLSWFKGYRDEEDQKLVFEYKKIAMRYIKGGFIIDAISIFPFQVLSDSSASQVTKLFRLPRMLRMRKLLDISNVK